VKIGTAEAGKGQKAFGHLIATDTRGRFPVHIPLHVIQGSAEGPTLVVQAGVSGLEIEPAMILPKVVEGVDASAVSGTLVVVPLMNTSGFEFQHVHSAWDNKNLNEVGRGNPDGTVSEKLIHAYYQDVIATADALVDFHTGAQWGYHRYAGVYQTGSVSESRELAVALGLPEVLIGQPADNSMAFEAAKDGKTVVSAWIGGGPGLRDHREDDLGRVRNAVFNAMKNLGMLDGALEGDVDRVTVVEAHTVLRVSGERGYTLLDTSKRGTVVRAGESIGFVKHPFTGDVLQDITAPRDGFMLHAGAVWPVMPEGEIVAIFGDVAEEVSRT
jgi:uncharacterized protein